MTNPPDTSVTERVARALHAIEESWNDYEWEYLPEGVQKLFIEQARAAISSMPSLEEENALLRPRSKDNIAGEAEALRSAADFLMAHYVKARCDSPAVSDCVNCNTVYLASTMLKLLGRAALSPRKEDQQPVEPSVHGNCILGDECGNLASLTRKDGSEGVDQLQQLKRNRDSIDHNAALTSTREGLTGGEEG